MKHIVILSIIAVLFTNKCQSQTKTAGKYYVFAIARDKGMTMIMTEPGVKYEDLDSCCIGKKYKSISEAFNILATNGLEYVSELPSQWFIDLAQDGKTYFLWKKRQ